LEDRLDEGMEPVEDIFVMVGTVMWGNEGVGMEGILLMVYCI
jgi:hypothetical protein